MIQLLTIVQAFPQILGRGVLLLLDVIPLIFHRVIAIGMEIMILGAENMTG